MKHNIDNQILQKLNMTAKKLFNCSARHAAWLLLLMVIVVGSPTTSTAGVVIKGNVYGGGNLADVGQSVTVNVSGGEVEGDVYGGGAKANTNKDNWNDATSTFTQTYHAVKLEVGTSLEGYYTDAEGTPATGTAVANVTYYKKTETIVNLTGGEVKQDVYGGGLGYDDAEDDTKDVAANVYGNVTVITTGGKARDVFGANNVKGTPSGVIVVNINGTDEDGVRNVYGGGNQATYEGGSTTVTMTAGKAVNVYGGGLSADVAGSVTVNIQGGTVTTDVYGGGALGHTNTGNWDGAALASTYATIVNLTDGTIGRDVYGGGLGRKAVAASGTPNTEGYTPPVSAIAALVYGNVTVNVGAVTTTPGEGDTQTTTYSGNITIGGRVFGCNNANGTPKGDVLVNVYKTAHTTGDNNNQYQYDTSVAVDKLELGDDDEGLYAIQAVYGGGNLAHYTPVALTGSDRHNTTVHVYVCDENTVKAIYGGGNAADVGTDDVKANTNVIIEGGRFYTVFGGGNGAGDENPGANIKGTAKTEIKGGLFNQIFGGSDTKGNVDVVDLSIESESGCLLKVNESFGGANMSDLTGDVITTLTCSDDITIGTFYGGSNQADINGNVTLNVYGGNFKNVYGGSKGKTVAENATNEEKEDASADISGNVTLNLYGGYIEENAYGGSNINGKIDGRITVNVLNNEGDCNLTIGGDIYGAGNETPYTPTYTPDSGTEHISPVVNLIHGTVRNVFGGARGNTATVTASPQVNIGYDDTTMGDLTTENTLLFNITQDTNNYTSDTQPTAFVAVVTGNVYGGGDLAEVAGSTTVNLRKANSTVGNIFGGGNAASVGNATVNVIDGSVSAGVYGGCNTSGTVGGTIDNNAYNGTIAVNVTGGTVGAEASRANVHGGGYGQATSTTGNVAVTINGASAVIWGDVYGGSALGSVNNEATDATSVTLTNGTVHGNLYGGGLGQAAVADNPETDENESVSAIAALVNGAVTVTVNGGTVVDVFGCNNVYGSPQNTVTVNINNNVGGNVYGGGNLAAYAGSPAVNVNHGTVTHSVYGGGKGNTAVVTGYPVVTIGDNNAEHYAVVTENVYGGGDAAAVTGNTTVTYNDNHASSTVANLFGGGNAAGVSGNTSVTLTSGTVSTAVYGGCNASGTVGGTSTVNVNGGQVGTSSVHGNVHGGGYGANTYISGNVEVNIGASTGSTPAYTGTATIYGDIYGGGALGHVNATENTTEPTYTANTTTTVNLNKGTIYGDAYGGGLGDNSSLGEGHTTHPAYVGGDVYVNLHEAVFNITTSTLKNDNNEDVVCATSGRIFGGNNINGTPKGHITVHVFNTVEFSGSTYGYDLAAVFGGGNEADYDPSAAGYAEVIIEGCDNTSIKDVYGGGNAAAVPATNVWILGSHIIQNVYGGGNGELGASHAAHVGFHRTSSTTKSNYANGSGETNVKLIGGNITNVYGGSNSNGDIRVKANVTMPKLSDYTNAHPGASTSGCCDKLVTQYVYGGGSQADLSGDVNVILECMPEDYVEAVYGGAQNADVNGSVELTVTSGKFGRVFGGNNTGGNINGSITVNVYEDGCKPLIIGELYGAGNNAPYSIYGLNADGTAKTSGTSDLEGTDAVSVNVLSCTSIGKVYGGGKGATAKVVGNTHVWINMLNGIIDGTPKTNQDDDYIGKIGQVFGGGSAADVIGNTTIDIGTATVHQNPEINEYIGVNIVSGNYLNPTSDAMNNSVTAGIYGGGEAADVDGNTTLNIGTKDLSEGTNINGNIFGGGLGETTTVTGNVQVNIGANTGTEASPNYVGYANITGDVYGGSAKGKVNTTNGTSISEGSPTTQVNLYSGTITGDVYGGGLGDASDAADVYGAVTVNVKGGSAHNVFGCNNVNGTPKSTVTVNIDGGAISESVYGGGNQAIMDGSPVVYVTNGTIGTTNEGGARYGNVYGGGLGSDGTGSQTDLNKVKAGLVKGNTEINISGGTIKHNIYGGGAYGSVGTFTYDNTTTMPTGLESGKTNTGKATINITGGTIGTNGKENGMVFGSSRGDVGAPNAIHDKLAWVYDTEVNIGTQNDDTDGPTINGSVYGGGENGHNYRNAVVNIYSGTIGINNDETVTYYDDPDDNTKVTYTGKDYNYSYRGNVYGGGCGTDKYDTDSDGKGDTYNPLAGIVQGNATVTMSGGTVIHNIYGAGAMGSVGATDNTGAIVSGGTTSITISGGTIGVDGDDNGNVFGAARGNSTTTQQTSVALVKTTGVTISGTADVKGNVYGGGEIGNVGTYTTSADGTNTYPVGSGVCAVTVSGGTVRGNVFGAGKGIADSFTSERAMVNSTSVTISNGTVTRNVYGGGEIGRVENDTEVVIGDGDGIASGTPTSEPVIMGDVFGGGQGVDTHGYSGLVRGNSTVTIEGNAKVRQNVYGGGETATVGKYWVTGVDYTGVSGVPTVPPDLNDEDHEGMPYATRAGGQSSVTIQGYAQVGPDAGASETAGHVFGAGKGVVPSYSSGESRRMKSSGWVTFTDPTGEAAYLQFLETLALVSDANVSIGGNATVKGNVYGGSESGFVQDRTVVQIQGGTIGSSGSYGNVYGGGKGLESFTEAGKVKGATNVAISGGITNGNVYGGGQLGVVQQNVAVTVSGGQVINDVYGGGALANTNTANWNTQGSAVEYVEVTGLTAGTTSVAGYYTRSGAAEPYTYTLITGTVVAANDVTYYKKRVVGNWATGKNVYNSTTEKYETTYKTTVDLTGGIVGNAYGGGLGNATHAANVYGDVEVTVNDPDKVSATSGNLVAFTKESESFTIGSTGYSVDVTGHVFGCNNINGTPTGNVTVHVFQTKYLDRDGVIHTDYHVPVGDDIETFEIQGVYGGGNQSDYLPADGKKTSVIIEGCQITSIKKVYGGGNSASVPATDVDIKSSYFIGYAFGGGNGGEHVKKSDGWHENEGAIVIGLASIACEGGKVGSIFGGSDAKGTCGTVNIDTSTENLECPRIITRLYGAGNEADINGHVNMILSSCSGNMIEYVHGGSYNANVSGDVTLTITSGIFKNVYGGNDARGSIGGDITVNIEETDNCEKPIIIQNLVGGGNNAPYPGIKRDGTEVKDEHGNKRHGKITVNVKSATRIDNVYGGCFNAEADADTEVNINMRKGNMAGATNVTIPDRYKDIPNIKDVTTPSGGNVTCTIKNEIGTIGNVYGGGNEGSVKGNTIVNIGTATTVDIMRRDNEGKVLDKDGNVITFNSGEMLAQNIEIGYVPLTVEGANITGDVYGGGNLAVVTGNTYLNICSNMQPVLDADDQPTGEYTYTPVAEGSAGVKIGGSVYGGGCENDVKSNTFVTMSGGYVFNGIFGGGYSGSVGTVTTRSLVNYDETAHTSHTDCVGGKPTAFAPNTGKCTVVVNGGQIGPVEVATVGMPNPHGWVWGGGCGLIEDPADDPDVDFRTYVNETDVTIGGTAFIMEGVIGGGEFGRVLGNTLVKIQGNCQIGVGYDQKETVNGVLKPKRYNDADFIDPTTSTAEQIAAKAAIMPECAHWPYGEDTNNDGVADKFDCLPYDPYFDKYSSPAEYAPASTAHPSDGKTWIGVVFGGGSGYMPYEKADGTGYDWIPSAGLVEGNTEVRITGGHVLTNVYGGNEITDVKGKCTVKMSGGTIGVPRTLEQIAAHPVTCYLFGAGKGDQRSHFNNMTNVGSVEVEVSGGIIYGSVFGGSEDGHVLGNVKVDIKPGAKIGTWGTSYVDGNVFGGGRGFSGDNLNAGSVGGTVTMNITGGTMLGSVYGGGRLGSVEDDITINISGGTIGNNHEYTYDASSMLTHTRGGNVFAGGMGRMYQLDGTTPISSVNWWELGNVKSTKLTISGGTIKSNVYGGGELGHVVGTHTAKNAENVDVSVGTEVIINGGTIGTEIQNGSGVTQYTFGSVYGGGYGSLAETLTHTGGKPASYPKYIAGRVKAGTLVNMTAGTVLASVYGGGEMAAVGESRTLGETLTTGFTGDTHVIISGGTIGKENVGTTYFGGAKMGNVYGGGSGHDNTVRSGHVYGNTNVAISNGTIFHNVYGGGAYGTVGDFTYDMADDAQAGTQKVVGINGLHTEHANSGVATVTITGGTIGIDGHNNGMVFGSSRGDIDKPNERDDYTAWAYDTHVTIGDNDGDPAIKGSVYGGGENGHTFNNTAVTVHSGTIGVVDDPTVPNRGNVYGSGCGTDKYYENHAEETHDGEGQLYNPLAGIVYGNATITIDGGKVVHNVYGGGSMGSVGKANNTGVITSGGQTTINISGGQIGHNGTGNGNVFGAARGDEAFKTDGYAQVKTTQVNINSGADVRGSVFGGGEAGRTQVDTHVNMSGGTVAQNVFGGGYLGNVGVIDKTDINNYQWADQVDDATKKTGICHVTVTGGTVGPANNANPTIGNVFGAGKGSGVTFQCENAMVYDAIVTVSNGTVNGDVFGGGEVGRVENNTKVTIGAGNGEGPFEPHINGDVFGGGKGLETHGYSALVRGNTEVTVQGRATIAKNVYGGGEIASVGRYGLNAQKMPNILLDGGDCKVTVTGNAVIGPDPAGDQEGNVYGAGKGVDPQTFDKDNVDKTQRSRRMTMYTNATAFPEDKKGTTWEYIREYSAAELSDNTITKFVWEYYQTKEAYASYLETLALATDPDVTIGSQATDVTPTINGSVFGGGELGLTKGSVKVTIKGGTIQKDVYGGGALANTNTTDQIGVSDGNGGYRKDGNGEYETQLLHSVTDVYLLGGLINGDAYGGGLGRINGVHYTQSEIDAAQEGDDAYGKTTSDWKVAPTSDIDPIEAKTFGEINVYLGGDEHGASTSATAFNIGNYTGDHSSVVKSGRVFGCNNRNGSPQEDVTVTVWKTRAGNKTRTTPAIKASNKDIMKNHPDDYATGGYGYVTPTYEVAAVYGGGNLASYTAAGKKTHVVIYGCDDTSIETVYGGGNAAAVTETSIDVHSCYEIGNVFGGGNGKDDYTLDDGTTWVTNPGADITGNSADADIKGTATTTWLYGGTIHEAYGGSNVKGKITGSVFIDVGDAGIATTDPNYCALDVGKIVAAGKNADVDGDLIVIMGCKPSTFIPLVYGGADNANVKGNVELTITSGNFGKVFGGNNLGGAIKGHIKLTIEETSCTPTIIQELYLGGNEAAYSVYGYYQDGTDSEGKPILKPRTAEMHAITNPEAEGYKAPHDNTDVDSNHPFPYADPELNIISCTSIGKVFGGGLGSRADMYANPTVNINMIPGAHATGLHNLGAVGGGYIDMQNIKHEGGVFGGGNEATVYGNTTVNIGTETEVYAVYPDITTGTDVTGKYTYNNDGTYTLIETTTAAAAGVYYYEKKSVEGANIAGNVYGGGNLADVTGNTYVNVCAYKDDNIETTDVIEYKGVSITGSGYEGVTITGNVFGGGKGTADSFTCAKAMVGEVDTNDGSTVITKESIGKGTRVNIGNGTIEGTVYGGGEIGRVEWNSVVTVGLPIESGTSAPEITGDVYGAGKGVEQYGYAALVRGNTFVTVQADAKVGHSVYGGGEISSVGKYNIVKPEDYTEAFRKLHPELKIGMPWSLGNNGSGYCNVTVRGNAEIGPDDMKMNNPTTGEPDDFGHVFGAGRGVLPYENETLFGDCPVHSGQKHPGRMAPGDETHPNGVWECFYDEGTGKVDEDAYLTFIETQGLATQTEVTIGGNAFVKGSAYGGSMDGHVQHDTRVTIADDCQIGAGFADGHSLPKYTGWPTDTENIAASWAECAHWPYEAPYAPYDKFATKLIDGKYYYDEKDAEDHYIYAEGGAPIAKDGHTWYGNVFGGGSGVIPYKPGKWHRAAGTVGGNTRVNITGGHILTSVYGGNEHTDVGTYTKDGYGSLVVPVRGGKCVINMTGGTIGVPRTEADAKSHPVTCYLFGAGKGDQRIFFNTWTNVISTEVNISGSARIYGSTFGGGEDGHIMNDAVTNIGGNAIIGTTGTSYVDGNVFGGGRGFSGDAQTAGTVGGNAEVNISGGTMLGSIYGGGRLASVGTQFTATTVPDYGNFKEDVADVTYTAEEAAAYNEEFGLSQGDDGYFNEGDVKIPGKHGHVTINISGGTIGNGGSGALVPDASGNIVSGNVFGGSMGRLTLLDGTTINPIWPKMAQVKFSTVNISGGTVKHNVYGGGEYGTVRDDATVTVSGGTVKRDVFGGGYGSLDFTTRTKITVKELIADAEEPYDEADYQENNYVFTPMIFAGCVGKNTTVNVEGGRVLKSVYGGGEMASVGVFDCSVEVNNSAAADDVVFTDDSGKWVYKRYHSHLNPNNGFALSWPYEFYYTPGYEGATHVNITGGRIGLTATEDVNNPFEDKDHGDVYGGGKGKAGDYKEYVFCANVGSAQVTVGGNLVTPTDANITTLLASGNCIAGAVYGGGQDGHVINDSKVTMTGGLVGHSMYGAGSGKGKFGKWLDMIPSSRVDVKVDNSTTPAATPPSKDGETYLDNIYSITAGRVFGNSEVMMSGGYVVRNIYGGGNLGSVGKGNYSGGKDDYSQAGYGETLTDNLWDGQEHDGHHFSDAFLHSGKSKVTITGGKVGYIDFNNVSNYTYSNLPYGNVFGGCRGEAAPNILESPRYEYSPAFFSGYVNETEVIIGEESSSTGPTIAGSVYGGGMDGHVRRDAKVTINSGEIGRAYTGDGSAADLEKVEWLHCGNVFGAGSGIGKYKYDFNYDGDYEDEVEYTTPGETPRTTRLKETDFSTSAGSVTRFTTVEIKGGIIHRNVYGGGSLATVGAPMMGQKYYPYHPLDASHSSEVGKQSLNKVIISGGTIGDATSVAAGYGGNVFGASRGDVSLGNSYSSAIYSDVVISQEEGSTTAIKGNVYGGGEIGDVKGNATVAMSGGTIAKNVYGGGKGDGGLFDCSKAMVGINNDGAGKEPGSDENKDKGTKVTISNGTVNGNVYGGGEIGRVEWNTQVTVGATSGDSTPKVEGSVFGSGKGLETHGYSALVRGNCTVTVQGAAKIGKNVYGGGEKATVGRYWVKNRNTTDPNTGQPFDDATPIPEDLPDGMPYKQQSGGICTVTIKGNAEIGYNGAADGAGHVFGAGQGVVPHYSDAPKKKVDDGDLQGFADEAAYLEFLETLALVTNSFVTIDGSAQVKGNVYGGSESGFVQHDTNVTIQDGTIGTSGSYGTVFGGGKGLSLTAGMTFEEAGKVKENTTVNILGGTMYGDVYGGGALGKSNTAVDNGNYPTATVNLKGGTITGSAFGGGLGDATTAANVGNTILHLNKDVETTTKGCIVKGYIFGANNVNGTPLGHALVHIHATQNEATSNLLTKVENYDVKGVFGGGNASDYVPASTDAKQSTEVIIEGCDLTSIEEVYGGGYGAATPATEVLIKGTYLIDNVFGGGYGAGDGNPGANVGIKTGGGSYGENVTGKANVKLMAGRIHHVYGASNTKGDISGGSSVTTVAKETPAGACKPICENLVVDDIYGGGQDAPMVGGTEVVLGCMPGDWIDEIYAGSENADVGNDVMLTITSGKFGRVFGGNKSGGKLDGGIVVNIEENPNCDTPIVIGELYGGGNEASYSAYGYKKVDGKWQLLRKGDEGANASASPVVVHAKAFTSIGKIFGGAKGSSDPEKEVTLLIGNPWVLVDEVETAPGHKPNGYNPATDTGKPSWIGDGAGQVKLYPHEDGEMGVVGTIFGGGNEAKVEGNTTVKIASYDYVVFWSAPELDDVTGFYTRSGEGTPASPYVYTEATGAPETGILYYKKVQGADIRGNIYGGGNNAEVTGDTNVVIGRKD